MIYDVRLRQFRSYHDDSFEFNPAVNIIVGPNASGKTNLLEGLLVLARGHSYRASDTDLVAFGKGWARLDARTDREPRSLKLTPSEPVRKTHEIAGKTYRRLPPHRLLPIVLFEPGHLRLLGGSPDRRRDYMDELLVQLQPTYQAELRRYKQALAQRNALLKQTIAASSEQLFPWNLRLSQLGGNLARARQQLVGELNRSITKLYQALSQSKVRLSLSYESTCDLTQYESSLLNRLEAQEVLDRQRGFTGSGPHRDDLAVLFDSKPASVSASRGEARTAVLALKILELELLEKKLDQKPLLLLDDVFSELDGARRHALTDHLADYQTFITTTDADIALANFGNNCTVIPLG